MKERNLTCIVCPRGCSLTAALDGDKVVSVVGNACPRGKIYAEKECTHPERTVTSTVKTADGSVVPCKTRTPVPKEKVFDVMKEINEVTAGNVLRIGDTVIENVAGTGVDVVICANKG